MLGMVQERMSFNVLLVSTGIITSINAYLMMEVVPMVMCTTTFSRCAFLRALIYARPYQTIILHLGNVIEPFNYTGTTEDTCLIKSITVLGFLTVVR
jgi:hypothetical protein